MVTTWGQLCGQALTPSTVTDEPLIQPSRDVQVSGTNRTEPSPELRGDIAVHGFWNSSQTVIPISPPIGTLTQPRSYYAKKRRKKTNTEHSALPAVVPSPH
jgi:hypothetical protein